MLVLNKSTCNVSELFKIPKANIVHLFHQYNINSISHGVLKIRETKKIESNCVISQLIRI